MGCEAVGTALQPDFRRIELKTESNENDINNDYDDADTCRLSPIHGHHHRTACA